MHEKSFASLHNDCRFMLVLAFARIQRSRWFMPLPHGTEVEVGMKGNLGVGSQEAF